MNTNIPLISIIIPTYNQAHYLANAIKSALAQSSRDFEVIVVDDGSTDETSKVVKPFGEQVRYVWQENQGLAAARNRGIAEARGAYIALLDSDDEWLPDFLLKMLTLIQMYPQAALYHSAAQCMDAKGNELPQSLGIGLIAPTNSKSIYWAVLRANFLIPSAVILRRSCLLELGGFDLAFRRLQDWELWLRLLQKGYPFAGTEEPLVRYRLHNNNLSTDPKQGQEAVMAIAHKHFGTDDEQPLKWSKEKRRFYGAVYRYHALTSLLYQNNWAFCGLYLRKMLQIDPSFAQDIDFFYELGLGNQPLGYRGFPYQLQLEQNARHLHKMLEQLFERPVASTLAPLRAESYSTAYHALGLLAYHTEQVSLSRRFLRRALIYGPTLIQNYEFIKLLCQVHLPIPMYIREAISLYYKRLRAQILTTSEI